MSNYKFQLCITPESIRNKLRPDQREKFNSVLIINAEFINNEDVILECLALEDGLVETPYLQVLQYNGCYLDIMRAKNTNWNPKLRYL